MNNNLMKKDLVMHFRVKEVRKDHYGIADMGENHVISPRGGVCVVGMIHDDPLLGKVIYWGVSLCLPTDLYNRTSGRHNAIVQAVEGQDRTRAVTKMVSYETAKRFAKRIAIEVWRQRGIQKPFKKLFDSAYSNYLMEVVKS
jgi:hypothetical protein